MKPLQIPCQALVLPCLKAQIPVYIFYWLPNPGTDNSDVHQFLKNTFLPPSSSKRNTKVQIRNVFLDNKYLHVAFEFIEIIVGHFTDDGVLEKLWFKHSVLQEETHQEWLSNPVSIWNAKHWERLNRGDWDSWGLERLPCRRGRGGLARSAWSKLSEGLSKDLRFPSPAVTTG